MALTGDELVLPLGIAFDRRGRLWVADAEGKALRRVSPDGVVSTIRTDDGEAPLEAPNYVAIGREGRVYLSDPCLGKLLALDGESGEVLDRLPFDLPTEGGPNGLALDSAGERLFFVTENTAILCVHPDVEALAEIAGLYAVGLGEDGSFGAREEIITGFAHFGDGLAFDAERNLYVVFDRLDGLAIGESTVWILPEGARELVPFLRFDDRLIANLAFGQGGFGQTTLYGTLLFVGGLSRPDGRGVVRAEVGIGGWPLLP